MRIQNVLLIGFLGVTTAIPLQAAEPWLVKNAPVRVSVSITESPEYPELGVYVQIPDGGLLPGPIPVPEVVDGAGKPLQSLIVGYNRDDGLGVVFENPSDGVATVYVAGKPKAVRPKDCKLMPSLIQYTKTGGKASLTDAERMAKSYPPAPGAHFGRWICFGSMVNPYGPDDYFSTWFTGCFYVTNKVTAYFATVSDEGSSFSIDGETVASWPGRHTRQKGAKGQFGKAITLEKGLHQVQYFHFELTGPQESQLVCKFPGQETQDGLPQLMQGEIVTSGEGTIQKIETQDGRLASMISGYDKPVGYFWTGEKPLNLFALTAMPVPGATVTFDFGKGRRVAASEVEWYVAGDADLLSETVWVETKNEKGITRTSARLVCPWTPPQMSLDNAEDRLRFRKAIYNRVRSVAPPENPCLSWGRDDWQILSELLEPYRGGPILKEIFSRGWESLQKRLKPEQRWPLEERWIETLRLARNDEELLGWIDRFEKAEKSSARKFRWKDERICAYLFDLNKPQEAKRNVSFLRDAAGTPDQTQISFLRQGDVARANGAMEAAQEFYKEAEKRYRARNKVGMAGGRLTYVGARKARRDDDASETNAVAEAKGPKKRKSLVKRPSLPRPRVDDWKIYTVHNASMYTTITTFLAQDAVPEALQKLSDWENETPAAKLSGEYPMAAARIYMHVKDYRRAVGELDIYTRSVEMSAQLADAMKLEIECLQQLGDSKKVVEVAKKFLQRFQGHPYEEQMKQWAAE